MRQPVAFLAQKIFHLAFAVGKFGEGESDCDFAGDINGAVKFLHSVVNAFVEITVMSRAFAPTFDKPVFSSFLLELNSPLTFLLPFSHLILWQEG